MGGAAGRSSGQGGTSCAPGLIASTVTSLDGPAAPAQFLPVWEPSRGTSNNPGLVVLTWGRPLAPVPSISAFPTPSITPSATSSPSMLVAIDNSLTVTIPCERVQWTVPPGVRRVSVYMWGAGGEVSLTGDGAAGAFVQGSLSVSPGEMLQLLVGGRTPGAACGLGGQSADVRCGPKGCWSYIGGGHSAVSRWNAATQTWIVLVVAGGAGEYDYDDSNDRGIQPSGCGNYAPWGSNRSAYGGGGGWVGGSNGGGGTSCAPGLTASTVTSLDGPALLSQLHQLWIPSRGTSHNPGLVVLT